MASNVLFPSLKSPVQINSAKKQLSAIVAGGVTGITLAAADVTKFTGWLAAPTYIEVAPVDANGNQLVRISAEGTAAIAAAEATPVPVKTPKTPLTFVLETGYVPPAINRSGLRASIYPFGTMEVGQSFFVPATTDSPDPAKSLASTVSAATRRYAEIVPGEFKPGRKAGNQVPVRKNTKEFTIRAVTENNIKGARIYREA